MKYYFVGLAGFGMSALAQIAKGRGNDVYGSDRNFDLGKALDLKMKFENMGIKVCPQDGSKLSSDFDAAIFSTAVEENNPEFKKAKELGIKIIHRADFLASYVNDSRTIAVSGTSGKSTVTAMIYHIMEKTGFSPSLVTGGALCSLMEKGEIGNAACGKSDWLVIEADESDGTLVKYKPYAGVILNISKDHKEISQLIEIFSVFAKSSGSLFVNYDDVLLRELGVEKKYFGLNCMDTKISDINLHFNGSSFALNGQNFKLPLPGMHNIANLIAAVTVCNKAVGISLKDAAEAIESFKGVYRRFNVIGEKNGITVIDDFAHNPAKVQAAISAALIDIEGKLIAVYQPHGFAPTRLLKNEMIESFVKSLRESDILIMPEIYYVGGTVSRDISSKDIVEAVSGRGRKAFYFERRAEIIPVIKKMASSKDRVIIMGARDLTLHSFATEVMEVL